MEAPPFFDATKPVDGITYYIIPVGTSLFRGDVPPNRNSPLEHISGPVFFGQTADVALIYGIPFEFITKSEVRLLALDKSMEQIYNNASKDNTSFDGKLVKDVIPSILEKNYGYINGIRNSDDAADKKLTKYICERYPGYATDFMTTAANGKFHREIVICDKNSVNFVQKLNTVNGKPVNEQTIRDEQDRRKREQMDADLRAEAQKANKPDYTSGVVGTKLSFGDFGSDSDEEGGGKSRKRIKSHKKQMRNKRRKTHKKGKPKKATHKRK
jgi:hypothetical protein